MGFWDFAMGGVRTPSEEWMKRLFEEQAAGKVVPWDQVEPIPASQLRSDYSDTAFGRHAAWLDNDWKLHRVETKAGAVKWELYNLATDRTESKDMLAAEPQRTAKMRGELEGWLKSVVASLNGADYK